MDKLTAIKIKYDDGTYSDEIPVSVLSENVEWDNTHTLVDVLGSIDVKVTGTIQDQISQLFNEKVSNSDMQTYITNSMPAYIANWLNTNVNPVGSAVIVDNSLTISGAAADAKVVRDEVSDLKSALRLINNGTYSSTEFVQGNRRTVDNNNHDTITAASQRCTTKRCFHLNKGDQLSVSGIRNDQMAAIGSSYGYDSGWQTRDYTYTATSEGYLFVNVAVNPHITPSVNLDITPSDISITVTVNDMSSITYKNAVIVDELKEKLKRKNLIGKNVGTKYPAKIKKGEKITVSSADGQVFSTSFIIYYLNANKEYTGHMVVPKNVNTYTITLNSDDVCFIYVDRTPQTIIQVEIGDTKTAYEPYFDDIHECDSVLWAKELSRKGYFTIDKNEMVDGTSDEDGYGDWPGRCHSKDIFIPAHKGDRVIASATNQQVIVAVTSNPMLPGHIFTTDWQNSIDIINEYEGYYILLGQSEANSFTGTFKIIPNVYTNNYENEVFTSEIEATIDSVRECQTEPSITFLLCTDIHYGVSENGNPYLLDKSAVNMKAVLDAVRTDFVVCLGDITEGDSVNTEAYSIKVNNTLRNLGIPYLLAIGNHDDNRYRSAFTADDMYKYYDSFVYNKVVFNEDTNGRDYYIDYDIYKTRFIIIDSNTVGAYGFASDTVSWFKNVALVTPNDYLAVVLVHESSVPSQNYNNSTLINGTAITSAITDYLKSGKPIIQFYGHSHCDVSFDDPFLSIGTNCLKFENTNGDPAKWPSGAVKPSRVVGTITEDCWDMVVLRPLSKKVDCIRFGAGSNRSFTY